MHDSLGQGETHVAVLHGDGGRGAVHLLERHLGVLHESGEELCFRPCDDDGDDNSLLSQLVQAFVYVCSCSLHDTKFHSRVVIMSSSEHKQRQ